MGKRDWRSFRFPSFGALRGAFRTGFAFVFTIALNSHLDPDIALAQELSQETEAQSTRTAKKPKFDGNYIIHLSESSVQRSSSRPEPGYFDDLVMALFDQAGLSYEIVPQMPWKRQMEVAHHEPGHVIYPTTRSDYREDAFKWVGPVSRAIWNLYGFKGQGWSDMDFVSLLRDARIGVLLGSAREAYLRQRGAEQLVLVPREELLVPMLQLDRVDLIAISGKIVRHYVRLARTKNPEQPIPEVDGAVPYRTCYLYMALSGDVPDQDITLLQDKLDAYKVSGGFVENRQKHGLSTNPDSSFLRAMLDLGNNGVSCVDLGGIGP
jgi:polar amino acid transport system substrate-binding protein